MGKVSLFGRFIIKKKNISTTEAHQKTLEIETQQRIHENLLLDGNSQRSQTILN